MQTLIAFVGLPVALWLTATGLGLLAETAARTRLHNALLAPLGFCVAISLLLTVYVLELHGGVAVGVLVAGMLAGLALAGRALPKRLNPGWPGLAALATYVLYASPMLLYGGWTWTGYNFLNDTAVHFLLMEHLKTAGTDATGLPLSTAGIVIKSYLGSGYPLGAHAYAATLSGLLGVGPEVIYVAFMASMGALASMALAVLGARTLLRPLPAAIVAFIAMASNLTYNYALQGSIKEIAALVAVATAAALAREVVAATRPLPPAVLLGISLGAILSAYNAAGLPYVLAILGTLALVVILKHRRAALGRSWLLAGAAVGAMTALASAAALTTIVQFFRVVSSVVDIDTAVEGQVLGNLSHPLPLLQAGGIWLDGNFGGPISPDQDAEMWTNIGLWVVAVLLALGVVEIVRRRCPEALLAIVPVALTSAVVAPRVVAYGDGKLLALLSPFVLLVAGFGLLSLSRLWKPIGPALGIAVAVGILLSDAYAFHDTKLAPRDRMVALREIGERLEGRGIVLVNEAEEFAKYFTNAAQTIIPTESITPEQVELRAPQGIFGRFIDLDAQKLRYVEQFRWIVMRRSPAASRPPANYRRAFANRYYEAWEQDPSGPEVLNHLPLQRRTNATRPAPCSRVRRLAQRAIGVPGAQLIAARIPTTVRFDVRGARKRSPSFRPQQEVPGTIATIAPGNARGIVEVTVPGEYQVWLQGNFPRTVRLSVDGRSAGTLKAINTPGQWLAAERVQLAAGPHRVRVDVGGGEAQPGDGGTITIGPMALVRDEPARLQMLPVGRWRTLCGERLDWIELVRP